MGRRCSRNWSRRGERSGRPVAVPSGIAVAPGHEIALRPFELATGQASKRAVFGGARGATEVPCIADWYMEGRIDVEDPVRPESSLEYLH